MKKTYITPEMLVQKIELHSMIAYSDPVAGINPNSSVSADEIESRESFSIWDDEE